MIKKQTKNDGQEQANVVVGESIFDYYSEDDKKMQKEDEASKDKD